MNISGLTSKDRPSNVVQEKEPEAVSLGKKGDIVEGVVKNVSDKITIDFNGREIDLPASTVQNAREGEKVKFQIMDVSNERIVLKTMGNADGNAGTQVAFTTVETGSTADILEQDTSEKEVVSEKNNHTTNTTTEDIREISNADSGIYTSIEEYTLEAFDRLLEALGDKKLMIQSAIDGQIEKIDKVREAIEKSVVVNRLPAGISRALAEYFVKYDIPVTEDNLQNISVGIVQLNSINDIDDKAVGYILKHDLEITAETIYSAVFSNMSINESVDGSAFESVKAQIIKIINNAGYQWNDAMENRAKFLFANDIPINEETLKKQQIMLELKEESREKFLDLMIKELGDGGKANQASLVSEKADATEQLIDIHNKLDIIEEKDIKEVIISRRVVTIKQLYEVHLNSGKDRQNNNQHNDERQSQQYAETIKVKRQLEEIRLSMTLQAARTLKNSGIDIETTELSKLVDELRNIEKEQYQKELSGYGNINDAELDTIVVTEHYRREIAFAPSYMLGEFVKTGMRETIATYAETAVTMTAQARQAQNSYEQLMTTPRADMGDSITKAFRNIDALLENIEIDVTEENRRVVKILAHNQMEITATNVNQMRDYDARIEKLLENLKPQTTLEIIRQGINPLEIPLEQLERHVEIINSGSFDNEMKEDASHSRFLWKLEKENRISEKERESYIGICRLLHQITKYDRAAVGAIVNSGVEFTLNNLLTAARSKNRIIEADVDDSFGEKVSSHDARQIENQINVAYTSYDELVLERLQNAVTPSKLYEISVGKPEELYDMPLEKMLDELLMTEENATIEDEYMEQMANVVREAAKDTEALRYVKAYGIEPTIYNINAMRSYLEANGGVISKLFDESEDGKEKEELINECEHLPDALEDDETIAKQYRKVTDAARHLYEMSESRGKIDISRLQGLTISSNMAKRRSFEIPVATTKGMTNINLTIVDSKKSRKEISIRMETEHFGTIDCELTINKNNVQALLVTSKFRDDGTLSDIVSDSITQNGYILKSFNSVVISDKKMYRPADSEWDYSEGSQLKKMYSISKNIVKGFANLVKEEQI